MSLTAWRVRHVDMVCTTAAANANLTVKGYGQQFPLLDASLALQEPVECCLLAPVLRVGHLQLP